MKVLEDDKNFKKCLYVCKDFPVVGCLQGLTRLHGVHVFRSFI